MEKRRPTYELASFQAAYANPATRLTTRTAIRDAQRLGFGRDDVVRAVLSMRREHFVKSMTSHADHRIWQDVYNVPFEGLVFYVKFTADRLTGFRLLSFKER